MAKIKELREKAKKIEAEARSKLAEADKTDDAKKAGELRGEFDALMDKYDGLVAEAGRLERLDEARAQSEEYEERQAREAREQSRPNAAADEFTPEGASSDEYREHFRNFLANGADMSQMEPEARDALRRGFASIDRRAQAAATGPAGGYLVPVTLANEIIVAMKATGPMWDGDLVTEIITGSGETIIMPGVDDTDQEYSAHAENSVPADDGSGDITITKDELSAFSYSTPFVKWSFELAQDSSFSFEVLLGRLLGERLGRTANRLLTVGTGAGQPLGFMNSAGLGHTAAVSGAITFDDVIELQHSVDPAYRGGSRVAFQMHDQTVKAVRKLKNAEGNYIWSDGDVTRGVPPSLLGHSARFNQAMDQIAADAEPLAFGDFGQYYVRKVGSPMIGVAREKFWPNLGMAGVARFDGAQGHAGAIKKMRMAPAAP
ncbi:MAG: phage major capsid protein [Pseudomonadota bacterium]